MMNIVMITRNSSLDEIGERYRLNPVYSFVVIITVFVYSFNERLREPSCQIRTYRKMHDMELTKFVGDDTGRRSPASMDLRP